jgi:integrase
MPCRVCRIEHSVAINPIASAKREIGKRIKAAAKTHPEKSFPCAPTAEVPHLLRAMRAYVGTQVTRSLLWFVALTACRTGEARFATWDEFDFQQRLWTIPAERMNARRPHIVPLSEPAIEILRALRMQSVNSKFVFPHPRRDDRAASENAILYALAAIGSKERMSGHGFRHLFSTLANESERWRRDVIEAALAQDTIFVVISGGPGGALRTCIDAAMRSRKSLAGNGGRATAPMAIQDMATIDELTGVFTRRRFVRFQRA